jgi:putative hydrolase of the HAD superfamily
MDHKREKKLVLDFGGVLTLEQDRLRFKGLLEELRLEPDAFFAAWHRHRPAYDRGLLPRADYWARVTAEASAAGALDGGGLGPGYAEGREARLSGELLERLVAIDLTSFMTPRAPMQALARELLARGTGVGILSNMPPGIGGRWIEAWPWLGGMDCIIWSGDEGLFKPDAAIYELFLSRSGWRPEQILFVDDVAANVSAARAIGFAAHHFIDEGEALAAIRAWFAI